MTNNKLETPTMKQSVTMLAVAAAVLFASPGNAATLDQVKSRGTLNCGANGQLPGFGLPDAQGAWTGFDVDYCRALAARSSTTLPRSSLSH